MKRVPPSSKSKAAIEELLQGSAEEVGDPRSTLLRLALQYIVEEALEAKTRDLLWREYFSVAAAKGRDGPLCAFRRRSPSPLGLSVVGTLRTPGGWIPAAASRSRPLALLLEMMPCEAARALRSTCTRAGRDVAQMKRGAEAPP